MCVCDSYYQSTKYGTVIDSSLYSKGIFDLFSSTDKLFVIQVQGIQRREGCFSIQPQGMFSVKWKKNVFPKTHEDDNEGNKSCNMSTKYELTSL